MDPGGVHLMGGRAYRRSRRRDPRAGQRDRNESGGEARGKSLRAQQCKPGPRRPSFCDLNSADDIERYVSISGAYSAPLNPKVDIPRGCFLRHAVASIREDLRQLGMDRQ